MKRLLPLLLLITLCAPALARDWPTASLFLTQKESEQATRLARQAFPAAGGIRLGAILYFGEDDWTIWLQGEKWTPETRRDDIRVIAVTPRSVTLIIRDENGEDKEVVLAPNETYIPD